MGLVVSLFALCLCFFISDLYLRHKHSWQVRGRNRYGGETYRVCLKCREAQRRVNTLSEAERWAACESVPELDSQFDKNDEYIFSS